MILIIYKIGQIFPSFHKKLIQTFISGLDAPRCSVWVKKKRAISKDVLFLPLFTFPLLFPTWWFSFYLSLFVPDPSAGLSSCLGCQYITGAPFSDSMKTPETCQWSEPLASREETIRWSSDSKGIGFGFNTINSSARCPMDTMRWSVSRIPGKAWDYQKIR